MEGIIIRVDSKTVLVEVEGKTYKAALRGKVYEKMNPNEKRPVAVGDKVTVSFEKDNAIIEEVHPRKNKLSRASAGEEKKEQVVAANIDQVGIVAAIKKPDFYPPLVDRILAAAENMNIPPFIIINKKDLDKKGKIDDWKKLYEGIGYDVIVTSVKTGEGLETLKQRLKGKITTFAGASGVGKSSLLNAIQPGLNLKTGSVSKTKGVHQGRHTTTFMQLLKLDFGGFVVDTPGIRTFGLWGVKKQHLGNLFIEFRKYIPLCNFKDCIHIHEPNCAVIEAVEKGEIPGSRYNSYLEIIEDLEE